MARTVTGVLKSAKKLLTTQGWVKGDDHRVEDGTSKFCSRGAVQIAAGGRIVSRLEVKPDFWDPEVSHVKRYAEVDLTDLDYAAYGEAMKVLDRVSNKLGHEKGWTSMARCDVVGANDLPGTSLDDVLEIFDTAIAVVEAEQLVASFSDEPTTSAVEEQPVETPDCEGAFA